MIGDRGRRVAAALGLAASVALAVTVRGGGPLPGDLSITRAFQNLHGPWLDGPLGALSALGFPPVVGICYGAIVVAMFIAGARREAWNAAIATSGAAGLHRLATELVPRDRPSADLIAVAHQLPVHSSFPSGHVQNATAFLGFLAYLLLVRVAPSLRRTALVALLIAVILGMGAARIYFGEHWPSDVLAGYLMGGVWLCVVIEIDRWMLGREARRQADSWRRAREAAVASMSKPRAQLTSRSPHSLATRK